MFFTSPVLFAVVRNSAALRIQCMAGAYKGPLWALNPLVIMSTKAMWLHRACVQSPGDYYYFFAPRSKTHQSVAALKLDRILNHLSFVFHPDCQSMYLIKYFSGSAQKKRKEKKESAKDLLISCQEVVAAIWKWKDLALINIKSTGEIDPSDSF